MQTFSICSRLHGKWGGGEQLWGEDGVCGRSGFLCEAGFVPLVDAPTFAVETQAAAWVRRQLAANRLRLAPGRDFLSWRPA